MTILVILNSVLGIYFAIRILDRENGNESRKDILKLIILGGLALFLWVGYLIGPILLMLVGLIPPFTKTLQG